MDPETTVVIVETFVNVLFLSLTALIGVELVVDWATGHAGRRWSETIDNVIVAIPNTAATAVVAGFLAPWLGAVLGPWRLVEIPVAWWSWPLALLAADLTYYVGHRLEHRVRLLWAHHSVHHSSTDYDLSTSARIAWHDPLIGWTYAIPMLIIGFNPGQFLAMQALVLVYQTWIHTRKVDRLPGWFEAVFNNPSAHRVHHGSNPGYLDCNYGGMLMIWDRLFGTWVDETEPVRFGLTRPLGSRNPLWVNFGETWLMIRDLVRRSGVDRLRTLVGPPEWAPAEERVAEPRAAH
jgi:sterol desaturase/sphingolipid hydroxylase (fatty acid hydroxylase superfamily)